MNDKTEPWKWGDENQPKPEEPPHIEGQRHLCCGYDAYMRPFDKGNWVAYEDYAKLRMERIHDLNQIGGLQEENARLKAEVERLTKAGDEMAFHYHQLELRVGNYSFSVKAPSIQAWEKAKEVQS
jgi:hypothetical protein